MGSSLGPKDSKIHISTYVIQVICYEQIHNVLDSQLCPICCICVSFIEHQPQLSTFPSRDVATKMLSRLINKLSRLFWTVKLQRSPKYCVLEKFQLVINCTSEGEISWQVALSCIPAWMSTPFS